MTPSLYIRSARFTCNKAFPSSRFQIDEFQYVNRSKIMEGGRDGFGVISKGEVV
jgi:hypothetical protein